MYAAYLGHRELCQLLILKGARVEDANEQNQTTVCVFYLCMNVLELTSFQVHNFGFSFFFNFS